MKLIVKKIALGIVIVLAGLPAFSQNQVLSGSYKMMPSNEVYKDSSLTTFICKLQYAVFKRDKDDLLSVVDKRVKNNFGGDDGIETFREIWKIDSPDSPVWLYLSKLISLGGIFSGMDNFVFPYVFSAELPGTLDVFSTMVVTAANVNIRKKPDKTSQIVGHFNYDVVTFDYDKSYPDFQGDRSKHPLKEWYYVSSPDKSINGYVYWDYVWSPVGYRLFLDKIDGEWKITGLVSGD